MNIAVIERQQPKESPSTSLVQVIERAARDPSVDIDKMERLLAMQERIMLKSAEAEFNQAMTAAQSEMSRISTDAVNPQTHSKYASYAQLDRHLRPIYTAHGFALSFDEAPCDKAEYIRVLCHVSHRAGFTRTYTKDMPADGKGAKGGDVMTKTHATGAAQSYAMRYLLKGIFNVAVGENDKDGNDSDSGPTLNDEQCRALDALLNDLGANRQRLYRHLRITSLDQIPAKNYEWVTGEVKRLSQAASAARGPK